MAPSFFLNWPHGLFSQIHSPLWWGIFQSKKTMAKHCFTMPSEEVIQCNLYKRLAIFFFVEG